MESYARGADIPVLEKTIGEILDDAARRAPLGEALISIHQGLRLTYHDLVEHVAQTARGLWGLGIRPGDRVGIWAPSCVEWVYLQVATARIGAVLVNVNPAYRAHELGFVLRKSRMKAIFLCERDSRAEYLKILEEASGAGPRPAHPRSPGQAGGQVGDLPHHVILLGGASWDEMIAHGAEPDAVKISPDDVVNIQYTSGTTGAPKGALLTHRNLVNNAWVLGSGLGLTQRDRICVPVPLYHCFGCVIGTLVALDFAATMVLPAAQFNPLATLKAIESERCTAIYGVPTMFIAELEHPDFRKFDLTSLRTGVMAGAPCPVEVMKRVAAEMHCPEMTIAYGLTETSPAVTMSERDDTLEHRVSTAGKALPNTEVKIVERPGGKTAEIGRQGELCTRGYLVMKGYDGEPEATRNAIDSQGWLHTGDLAIMRPDGYLRITGRAKEMIIRGGENIYPREIEEFLHQHPKIADAYVTGLPDRRLGETVLAWIQVKAGETLSEREVREFCEGRVAHFKIPQFIRFVDSFPMTVTGKVQKYKMREIEVRERGLEGVARIETA
jgi:fatty-acyl-CoA synthase